MSTERGKGYCPHKGMSYMKCPECGGEEFYTYPQSIAIDSDVWTYEYTCTKCSHIIGVTVRNWRKQ
jgi:DNA-directed RNA polymerase subunit M/transcription elongation factor TFIIS